MAEPNDYENNIFGQGFERCPVTSRPYEKGSGALSHEQQTAMFIRERDREQQRQAAAEASAPAPGPNAELPAPPVAPLGSDSKTVATRH
jgi:hypothetical protein